MSSPPQLDVAHLSSMHVNELSFIFVVVVFRVIEDNNKPQLIIVFFFFGFSLLQNAMTN
jgi:hypothetical protein